MDTVAEEVRRQLSSGERVLWTGQPKQGVIVRGSDALMIPFSLVWGGFAFFWEWSVINSNAPAFFVLWGIPFVLVGIYLIVGRFFVEARQREKTHYAVTNERVLIISGLLRPTVKSLSLRTLTDVSLSESSSGEGSITFGATSALSSMFGGFAGWPGMGAQMGPRFDVIPEAKTVYETIRTAQRGAN
jgi:Bacterial PH domain